MRLHILLIGALCTLAACDKAAPGGSNSTAATAGASALAGKPPARVPGEWEFVSKVDMVDVEGAPAAVAAQMKAMNPPAVTQRQCMSKAEAEEDITKAMQKEQQSGCRFERVQTTASTIAGTAICSAGGMESTGEMTGTVTPTNVDMTADMTMKMPVQGNSGPATMKMRMKMNGRRIGDCPK